MKSRIEAIQKLQPPTTAKSCKSFCGVVNYLSLFCKDLQKILKPIYELTRKEMPFHWSELHQKAFVEVKEMLVKPQSYICADQLVDLFCIVIHLRPIQAVHFGKYRMVNLDC